MGGGGQQNSSLMHTALKLLDFYALSQVILYIMKFHCSHFISSFKYIYMVPIYIWSGIQ